MVGVLFMTDDGVFGSVSLLWISEKGHRIATLYISAVYPLIFVLSWGVRGGYAGGSLTVKMVCFC